MIKKDYNEKFQKLVEVIKTLHGPDDCPWDEKQTPQDVRTYLLEEIYETIEAIDEEDTKMKNRFYTFNQYLREKYGERVQKITIHAHFSCPNRNGTLGESGCIYCNNLAFNPQLRKKKKSIAQQIEQGIRFAQERYGVKKFIAYFQTYTNTYASIEELKLKYDEIRKFPQIVGLSVGTRPDCIDDEKLEFLYFYEKDFDVWIEYGLQSACDRTLKFINRGHNFDVFKNAVINTKNKGIKVCAHMIIGLPGESKRDYIFTAKKLAQLKVDGVKIHPIHVVKDTKLEQLYISGKFNPISFEDYVKYASTVIEYLPAECIIHRVGASALSDLLLAPDWLRTRKNFSEEISKELKRRDSWQGRNINTKH